MTVRDRGALAGLLLLTMATGVADAVGYLALDGVFTGNMTGNVLFVGFALIGVDGIPLANNALALAGFMLGAACSGRVVNTRARGRFGMPSLLVLMAGEILLLGSFAFWMLHPELSDWQRIGITTAISMAMGAQVIAVKPIGNSDVTTVVVTNTLANLSSASRLAKGPSTRWAQRALAILAMGVGAALGAGVLQLAGGVWALLPAVAISAAALVVLGRCAVDRDSEG